MKKFALILLVAFGLGLSALVLAGPTVGFGVGYSPDTIYLAPSFGFQWIRNPGEVEQNFFGLDSTMHLTFIRLETGDDFDMELAGFWEVIETTWLLPGDPAGLHWRLIVGIGSPFLLEGDGEDYALRGMGLGWLAGLSMEWPDGSGFKVMAFTDWDVIGVALTSYWDLFSAPALPGDL